LGELIVEIVRSGGTLIPSAAAEAASSVGAMNLPELFLTDAYVNPFCRA
jgi:ABC-type amino acid transport system permease subunit